MVLTLLFAERLIYGDARGVLAGQHRLLRSRLGCVRRCVRVRASFVWSLEKANESILMGKPLKSFVITPRRAQQLGNGAPFFVWRMARRPSSSRLSNESTSYRGTSYRTRRVIERPCRQSPFSVDQISRWVVRCPAAIPFWRILLPAKCVELVCTAEPARRS